MSNPGAKDTHFVTENHCELLKNQTEIVCVVL